jgi:hypothetical protein
LHFVESQQRAQTYLHAIRTWLDAHPSELIVLSLSRHGSACRTGQAQYPNVTVAVKQAFWRAIELEFDGLLFDARVSTLNTTTIAALLERRHRVIVFAADYAEFTASSPYALDSCVHIDNRLGSSVANEPHAMVYELDMFEHGAAYKAADKLQSKFLLMSMAAGAPNQQMLSSFFMTFFDYNDTALRAKCAASFNLPNVTRWCPGHLQSISQLTNFYGQRALETAHVKQWDFPNAIYLDAVDVNGTIRTSAQLFDSSSTSDDSATAIRRYAYADTLIHYNVRRICAQLPKTPAMCGALLKQLEARRARYPLAAWQDETTGRLANYP